MRKFKIRNVTFDFSVTLAGYLMNLDLIPFRWSAPAFRWSKEYSAFSRDDKWGFHIFAGPIHIWTSGQFSALIEFSFKVGQNPFHGTALVPRRPAAVKEPS